MKRLVLLGLLACLPLALAGELQQLHARLAPAAAPPEVAPQESPIPGATVLPGAAPTPARDPGITEIGLERTRCLAGCPAYTLIIRADGSFRYLGEYGVERLGEHRGTVSLGRLKRVLAFIAETPFDAYDASYRSPYLDGPTAYVMVRRGEAVKVVEDYAGSAPATLWAVEELIDDLLETAEWNEADTTR